MVATVLVARFTAAKPDKGLAWSDVRGLSMLAGIGFTVSLQIGELSFGLGTEADSQDKVTVLVGSLLAAVIRSVLLGARARVTSASQRPTGAIAMRTASRVPTPLLRGMPPSIDAYRYHLRMGGGAASPDRE